MARKDRVTPTRRIGPWITEYQNEKGEPIGYAVRIRRAGVKYDQYFAVKEHGTAANARNAARTYCQQIAPKLPKRQATRNIKTRRNKSGKVGVHLARGASKKWPGSESWAYVAGWLDSEGNHRHVSFALAKYGERTAWKLACIARDNELRDRDRILKIYEAQKRKKPTTKA